MIDNFLLLHINFFGIFLFHVAYPTWNFLSSIIVQKFKVQSSLFQLRALKDIYKLTIQQHIQS